MSKKIMFSDRYGLTEAVLEGRKTMTRRLVKSDNIVSITTSDGAVHHVDKTFGSYHEYMDKDGKVWLARSPYKVGEVVAIAQAYKDIADTHFFEEQCAANEESVAGMKYEQGWNNKMFVKSYYMLHRIQITDIKMERLQDISDEDVYKEGFTHEFVNNNWGNSAYHEEAILVYYDNIGLTKQIRSRDPKEAFSFLIDKVSGKGTWESNPWVFVYSFKLYAKGETPCR